MATLARKVGLFIIFIALWLAVGRIDYYYQITPDLVCQSLIDFIAKIFNVEGMAETLIDIHELIAMFYTAIMALFIFSFFKILIISNRKKNNSLKSFIKQLLKYIAIIFIKAFIAVIAICAILYIVDLIAGNNN